MTYEVHPAAAAFPMMSDDDLLKFAEDIERNGLIHPIELLGNLIIDGRNRLRACELVGVTPRYIEIHTADPIRYVTAANIHRRHLTTQQRAAIAAELANLAHGSNQHKNEEISNDISSESHVITPVTIAEAAELMGVGTASVSRAKATMRDNPEAHEAAKRGESKPKPKREKKPAEKKPENEDMGKKYRQVTAINAWIEATGIQPSHSFVTKFLMPEVSSSIPYDPSKCTTPLTDAQAEDIRRVVFAYAERTGKAKHLESEALEEKEETSVDREIKRRMRVLEAQMEERTKAHIDEILKTYSEEYARYKSFNDSYKGVFAEDEYRLLLSVLHPDRCPPERAAQFSRAFHLVKSKEEILCGAKDSDSPKTLPSSLAELMARRKMN